MTTLIQLIEQLQNVKIRYGDGILNDVFKITLTKEAGTLVVTLPAKRDDKNYISNMVGHGVSNPGPGTPPGDS